VRKQAYPVRRPCARAFNHCLTATLACDHAILIAHRARNPRDVVMRDKATQRSGETAATTPDDPLAIVVTRKGDRAAVRNDDQLPALQRANAS
jgi:hypothetical protein